MGRAAQGTARLSPQQPVPAGRLLRTARSSPTRSGASQPGPVRQAARGSGGLGSARFCPRPRLLLLLPPLPGDTSSGRCFIGRAGDAGSVLPAGTFTPFSLRVQKTREKKKKNRTSKEKKKRQSGDLHSGREKSHTVGRQESRAPAGSERGGRGERWSSALPHAGTPLSHSRPLPALLTSQSSSYLTLSASFHNMASSVQTRCVVSKIDESSAPPPRAVNPRRQSGRGAAPRTELSWQA